MFHKPYIIMILYTEMSYRRVEYVIELNMRIYSFTISANQNILHYNSIFAVYVVLLYTYRYTNCCSRMAFCISSVVRQFSTTYL